MSAGRGFVDGLARGYAKGCIVGGLLGTPFLVGLASVRGWPFVECVSAAALALGVVLGFAALRQ